MSLLLKRWWNSAGVIDQPEAMLALSASLSTSQWVLLMPFSTTASVDGDT